MKLFWVGKDNKPVSSTNMSLSWNAQNSIFVGYNDLFGDLPQDATSGRCLFLESNCITSTYSKACWSAGYLDGEFERYNGDGKIIEQGEYSAGKISGKWTYYDDDGSNVTERREYTKENKDEYYVIRYKYGEIFEEGTMVNNQKHGYWKHYFEPDAPSTSLPLNAEGIIAQEGNYDMGNKIGQWITYYIEYDINKPEVPDDAYYQNRQGINNCISSEKNFDTGEKKIFIYGSAGCPATHCNPGLVQYEYIVPNQDNVCKTPSGKTDICASTVCQ